MIDGYKKMTESIMQYLKSLAQLVLSVDLFVITNPEVRRSMKKSKYLIRNYFFC